MPLYRCTKCDVIENTALGGYWMQQMAAHKAGVKHEPLCSQCDPAIRQWHDKFPRQAITPDYVQTQQGYLYRNDEAERNPHMGPFAPVDVI